MKFVVGRDFGDPWRYLAEYNFRWLFIFAIVASCSTKPQTDKGDEFFFEQGQKKELTSKKHSYFGQGQITDQRPEGWRVKKVCCAVH